MAVKSLSKWIILFGSLVWMACGDIARDNVLDPLNPESTHPRNHLIEAFVNNSGHPSRYNQWMLDALNDLEALHEEDLIIAVYHRSIGEFEDADESPVSDVRYDELLDALDDEDAVRGVPDVFVNGLSQRVQGASSASVALDRLQTAYYDEDSRNHKYYLNVQTTSDGTELSATVTLARLGNQSANGLRVQAMVLTEFNDPYRRHVVSDLEQSDRIDNLDAGEIKSVRMTGLTLDPSRTQSLVVAIMNEDASYAYQTDVVQIN